MLKFHVPQFSCPFTTYEDLPDENFVSYYGLSKGNLPGKDYLTDHKPKEVMIQMSGEKMLNSATLCKKKLSQTEPGVLILEVTSHKWKEVLLRKAMVNIIRERGQNELPRHIKELLVEEKLSFENTNQGREPFIPLKIPVMLKNGDQIRIFILVDGLPKSEVFTLKT